MTEPKPSIPVETESDCRQPCDPNVGCGECADYWQRMINQGFWDQTRQRWTEKGWREIMRRA